MSEDKTGRVTFVYSRIRDKCSKSLQGLRIDSHTKINYVGLHENLLNQLTPGRSKLQSRRLGTPNHTNKPKQNRGVVPNHMGVSNVLAARLTIEFTCSVKYYVD